MVSLDKHQNLENQPFATFGHSGLVYFFFIFRILSHFSFEVGANWVHFSNMKKSEINPIELMVKEAHLKTVSDDYSDVIFRYKGCMGEQPCH